MPASLDATGERCVPWSSDLQMVYEHLHRYAFAATLVRGRKVLDLASGEGYGADLMARAGAAAVVGIEIDAAAVDHARRRYRDVEFRRGSILDPAVAEDGGYEVVTCFEALEHVDDHAALMTVVRTALRPGGLFVVSTPDTEVYTGELHTANPFHVHELDADGFAAWLDSGFARHAVWRQSAVVGSLLEAADPMTGFRYGGLHRVTKDDWLVGDPAPAPYLVAVASDGPLPDEGTSLFSDVDLGAVREANRESRRLADELRTATQATRRSTGWEENAAALRDQIADLTGRLDLAVRERDALVAELAAAGAWRANLESSRGWQVLRLLRAVRRRG